MNNLLFTLFFLVLLVVGPGIQAQDELNLCQSEQRCFKSGEKLQYSLYYNWNFLWINAGILEFEITEVDSIYKVEVVGKTHDHYEWFYKVEDYYSSSMDKESLLPINFQRNIKEGKYSIINKIDFDYENKKISSSVKLNDKATEHYDFPLDTCIHDLLSLTYNLRNVDIELLKQEKVIESNLLFDEKLYKIPIRYIGEEQKKMIRGIGRLNTLKISPGLISGNVFNERADMMIWVSDDENRIPLLIETPVKVGSIKAILKSYENILEPWTQLLPLSN